MGVNTESAPLTSGSQINGVMEAVYKSQPWYQAYMAALFESDRRQIGERIRRAEVLIVNRARELFRYALDSKEQRALDNAVHALRALQGCLKL